MLDAKITRFPFIFFNLYGCRILLATTSPLRGAIYVVSFLWKRCVKRGNIVAEANVSQFAAPGNICCGSKICFPGRKNVSEFTQNYFASSANVSQFAATGNICCGSKICFPGRKNVSEFTQNYFASSANVSQFAAPGNICCGSKTVCEFILKNFASSANVSSFARRGKFRETMFPYTTFPRFSGAFRRF